MGIWRVLDESGSGRGFLQEHGLRFQSLPTVRNYFQSLRSERRADLVTELNAILLESTRDQLTDRLADIPELDAYEVFAVDGHWHTGATHDPKVSEKKVRIPMDSDTHSDSISDSDSDSIRTLLRSGATLSVDW